MTVRTFNIYSYSALAVAAILLIIVALKAVPQLDVYLLSISILIFIVRIVLRIYFSIQQKKSSEV
jgi:hypothetical protein